MVEIFLNMPGGMKIILMNRITIRNSAGRNLFFPEIQNLTETEKLKLNTALMKEFKDNTEYYDWYRPYYGFRL